MGRWVSSSPLPSLGFLLSSKHLFRGSGNLQLIIHLRFKADPFDHHQMREEAKSAGSSKRREVDDRLMNEKDPPPYGAQQRQDGLWEGEQSCVISAGCLNKTPGGNEALPPQWHLFEVGGDVYYQDDNLVLVTSNRPLPGVRLGELSQCYHKQGTHS